MLHHYLNLSTVVDWGVVTTLTTDLGIDIKAEANQKYNSAIIAAKNPRCTLDTL